MILLMTQMGYDAPSINDEDSISNDIQHKTYDAKKAEEIKSWIHVTRKQVNTQIPFSKKISKFSKYANTSTKSTIDYKLKFCSENFYIEFWHRLDKL